MRVLLATDGSPDARMATESLRNFPLPSGSSVLVVTVAAVRVPPREVEVTVLRDAVVEDAHATAEAAAAHVRSRWPDAETRVVEGDPRERIVETAEDWKADLVVVGARGLNAVERFFLGSVSLEAARRAPCPVLVVKGDRRGLSRAIVAVDGSEGSRRALEFFTSLSLSDDMEVRLVGVVQPPRFPTTAPGPVVTRLRAAYDQLLEEARTAMREALEGAAAAVTGKLKRFEVSTPEGIAADEIVRAAEEWNASLVVIGGRGFGRVERLLLGTVSENVLRHAPCPVLIVKWKAA